MPPTDLTNWELLGPLLVAGIGSGLFIAPNAQFIVATVDRSEAGAATGVIGTMQRMGSAIGIAVIGSVLFAHITEEAITPTASQIAGAIKEYGAQGKDAVTAAITAIAEVNRADVFGDAAALALGVSAVFAVVAFALVFVLPKRVSRGYEVPSAD